MKDKDGRAEDGSDGGRMTKVQGRIAALDFKQSLVYMDIMIRPGMSGGPVAHGSMAIL